MYFPINPVAPKTRMFEKEAAMMKKLIYDGQDERKRGICLLINSTWTCVVISSEEDAISGLCELTFTGPTEEIKSP
jgi:hypothetical protein